MTSKVNLGASNVNVHRAASSWDVSATPAELKRSDDSRFGFGVGGGSRFGGGRGGGDGGASFYGALDRSPLSFSNGKAEKQAASTVPFEFAPENNNSNNRPETEFEKRLKNGVRDLSSFQLPGENGLLIDSVPVGRAFDLKQFKSNLNYCYCSTKTKSYPCKVVRDPKSHAGNKRGGFLFICHWGFAGRTLPGGKKVKPCDIREPLDPLEVPQRRPDLDTHKYQVRCFCGEILSKRMVEDEKKDSYGQWFYAHDACGMYCFEENLGELYGRFGWECIEVVPRSLSGPPIVISEEELALEELRREGGVDDLEDEDLARRDDEEERALAEQEERDGSGGEAEDDDDDDNETSASDSSDSDDRTFSKPKKSDKEAKKEQSKEEEEPKTEKKTVKPTRKASAASKAKTAKMSIRDKDQDDSVEDEDKLLLLYADLGDERESDSDYQESASDSDFASDHETGLDTDRSETKEPQGKGKGKGKTSKPKASNKSKAGNKPKADNNTRKRKHAESDDESESDHQDKNIARASASMWSLDDDGRGKQPDKKKRKISHPDETGTHQTTTMQDKESKPATAGRRGGRGRGRRGRGRGRGRN